MIPKDFYKHREDYSLYTSDFNTEVYDSSPQTSSYRIDIRTNESNGNYNYHYKIFGLDGKLLTINGWTLKGASFSQAWTVNFSPMVNITDPQGICLDEYKIPSTFSKQEKNCGGEIENRLRETFSFMQYISQYQSLYDFKTVHDAALSNMENVMRFYLECLKIKERLPQQALVYITDTIKKEFENYLQKQGFIN